MSIFFLKQTHFIVVFLVWLTFNLGNVRFVRMNLFFFSWLWFFYFPGITKNFHPEEHPWDPSTSPWRPLKHAAGWHCVGCQNVFHHSVSPQVPRAPPSGNLVISRGNRNGGRTGKLGQPGGFTLIVISLWEQLCLEIVKYGMEESIQYVHRYTYSVTISSTNKTTSTFPEVRPDWYMLAWSFSRYSK